MTANFSNLLHRAKNGDEESFTELLLMYKPLLLRESVAEGIFDEDLYQVQCIVFWRCVKTISVSDAGSKSYQKRESPNDYVS